MYTSPERSTLPLTQRIGAVAWPSFFAAAVATVIAFALIDPVELAQVSWPRLAISRELGYTLGFFAFWLATGAASLFTAVLLTRAPSRGDRPDDEDE
jgi:hypothetical protein